MSLLNLLEEFIKFEKIRKMKNKKGFTLVELIVVLVILAILAALLVPALTGYIDKAREQSLISEGAMVLTAAQATVSEGYGTGDVVVNGTTASLKGASETDKKNVSDQMATQINQLAELKANASWSFSMTASTDPNYKAVKVATLVYSDGKNAIVYSNGNWGSTMKGVDSATAAAAKVTGYTAQVSGNK